MYFSSEIILVIVLIIIIGICIFTYNVQSQQLNEINILKSRLIVKNENYTPESSNIPLNNSNTPSNNSLLIQNNQSDIYNSNHSSHSNHSNHLNHSNHHDYSNHYNHHDHSHSTLMNQPAIIDETIIKPPRPPLVDPIKVYDYRVLEDPMKDPKRRLPRYSLGPLTSLISSPLFNIPTRGWRDNYSLQGYLVDHKASSNDPNKIIQLFGRQKWPNSSQYEYYVTFQSGHHERKYELEKYTKELYDKDEVFVDILNDRRYEVKLFKQESMEYNPFWF